MLHIEYQLYYWCCKGNVFWGTIRCSFRSKLHLIVHISMLVPLVLCVKALSYLDLALRDRVEIHISRNT